MGDQLKFIVTELKNPPWEKSYSVISFDSLSPEQLLQVLTDVLGEIDVKNKVDIREEDPERMAVRFLSMLRGLKYRPPDALAPNFRRRLIEGDKIVVHSVLQWILERPLGELKRRAYLAKFLVRVEIPPEALADPEVDGLYKQYEKLIEEFVVVHREREAVLGRTGSARKILKDGSGDVIQSAAEMRTDLETMEREKDQVTKWLERIKSKVVGVAGADQMLSTIRALRLERIREGELIVQGEEETLKLKRAEESIARLRRELAQARKEAAGATAEGILKRLEEEIRLNSYLAKEKLPTEVSKKEAEVEILREVAAMEPPPSKEDINNLRSALNELMLEISKLAKPQQPLRADNDEADELLAPYRQQAAITARKKNEAIERLTEARKEIESLEEELKEAKKSLMSTDEGFSDTPPEGEALREYITSQNARTAFCKQKRVQLAALKAEVGVLVRTQEVLLAMEQDLNGNLPPEDQDGESRRGSLFGIDDEMAKADLNSLQKELRQLREQYQDLKVSYDKRKRLHDSLTAGIESEATKIEQEIKKYWEEYISLQREKNLSEANLKILEVQKERLEEEKLIQKGRGKEDGKRNSFWEDLKIQIAMEEKETRQLKESQKVVNEGHDEAVRQVKMWKNLASLLSAKKKCVEAPKQNIGTVHREKGAETLVLP